MIRGRHNNSRRRFLQALGGVGATAGATHLGLGHANAAPPGAVTAGHLSGYIDVGSRRQLLFDDFLVGKGNNYHESLPYGIRWNLGRVRKSPEGKIFKSQEPWHDSTAWFNVLYDGGRYRMWYCAAKAPAPGLFVCYAESDDGISWRRPLLNLIDQNGSKANNIVYTGGPGGWQVELGNVFRDPIAQPEERYKMIYAAWLGKPGEDGVTMGATSSDGLNWTRSREIYIGRYCDSQNVATYDPVLGKYVAYVRWSGQSYGALTAAEHPVAGASRGRAVARMVSDDYKRWSCPEVVLSPDFEDGLNVEFYGPSYACDDDAESAHFMFPAGYHIREGIFLPQVAVSRDNQTWLRPTRDTFIPDGPPGAFDDHIISVCPGILPAGKDTRALYYRSANVAHPGALPKYWVKPLQPANCMGRIEFTRDRIVGIEAGRDGGGFWTRPLQFEGNGLTVNLEPTGPDAQLQVQLIGVGLDPNKLGWARGEGVKDGPCPGYTFEDSIPVGADGLDAAVAWKGRSGVGEWAGKRVRLQFRLRSVRIYAFQFH